LVLYHKFILLMMVCSIAALINGCENTSAKQTNNVFNDKYPVQLALHSMGESFQDNISNLSVTQHVNSGESPDKAMVTIEESGLLDDSVSAEKTVFTMDYQKDKWQIVNRVKTQRCYPERGHQDFSGQPCN